jgi:gamma-glutamyl:cysteine ligase YbdK (ATP-grasp superfamily)
VGQEINTTEFTTVDEENFRRKLRDETKILKRWFDSDVFDKGPIRCGLELEAWLVTKDFVPAPVSDQFIEKLKNPLVVPEISKFNFELNSDPLTFKGEVFTKLEDNILRLWKKCEGLAEEMDLKALIIGTLPTLKDHMLTMDQLSPQKRYFALNNQVMKLRGDKPINIHIEGREEVHLTNTNMITECAATSLQIHFGVTPEEGPKYYNASIIASSFMAATCSNSPYFYGRELWDESRVAIFEQSVNIKSFRKKDGDYATRVTLGNGYVHKSLMELFIKNLDGYPILLPDTMDSDPEWLDHLRLQNGTIWRWNRPLVGLTEDGRPSLRLEFRVPSAGPTIKDSLSNMAFQIALVEYFKSIDGIEESIPFEVASKNFYNACKFGLASEITWIDGESHNIQSLLINEIFPHLVAALEGLGVKKSDCQKYLLDVIKPRIQNGQNGANWQKAFVRTHGPRFQEMLEVYYKNQKENIPVHLWKV